MAKKIKLFFTADDSEGETAQLLKVFKEHLENESDYTTVTCYDIDVIEQLLEADTIVVFTPTYWFGIPSRLQAILEKLTYYEDKQWNFMSGKKFAAVQYSPHGGDVQCLQQLALVFNGWGCTILESGLLYFRSIDTFENNHWNLKDLQDLAKRI